MIRWSSSNKNDGCVNRFTKECMDGELKDFIIIVLSILLVLVGVAGIMHYRNYKKHVETCNDENFCNPKANPRMLFGVGVILGVIGLFYALVMVYISYR